MSEQSLPSAGELQQLFQEAFDHQGKRLNFNPMLQAHIDICLTNVHALQALLRSPAENTPRVNQQILEQIAWKLKETTRDIRYGLVGESDTLHHLASKLARSAALALKQVQEKFTIESTTITLICAEMTDRAGAMLGDQMQQTPWHE